MAHDLDCQLPGLSEREQRLATVRVLRARIAAMPRIHATVEEILGTADEAA